MQINISHESALLAASLFGSSHQLSTYPSLYVEWISKVTGLSAEPTPEPESVNYHDTIPCMMTVPGL